MNINTDILLETNVGDVLVGFLTIVFCVFFYRHHRLRDRRFNTVLALFILEHITFTLIYYLYSLYNIADATAYYERGLAYSIDMGYTGTSMIYLIVHILTSLFGLKFFALYWPFSLWGLMGITWLFKICISLNEGRWSRWFWLFLLPNMHYWSVAIGKDSIAFTGVVAVIYLVYYKRGFLKMAMPLILLFFIRPHILLFGLVAYFATLILSSSKGNAIRKIFLSAIVATILILAAPFLSTYIGTEDGQGLSDRLIEMESATASYYGNTGSDINLQGQNIVVKWVSFMFRPFIFEAHNITSAMASLENSIWLVLFFLVAYRFKSCLTSLKNHRSMKEFLWFAFYGFWVNSLFLSYLIYNLGLAQREKNNFFPYFMIVLIIVLAKSASTKKTLHNHTSYPLKPTSL